MSEPQEEFSQYARYYRNKRSIYRFKVSLFIWVITHVALPLVLVKLASYSPSTIDAAIRFLDRFANNSHQVRSH